jgi:G3E family GTPase
MTSPSLPAAAHRQRIPLTVIGGYLGAGKTTLINQVLRHPGERRLAVVVNDFGSIGIDALLLQSATTGGSDRVVSLPNGCVCCTVGSGLQEALAALLALEPTPDHVIVEVSGVADPATAAAWATVPPFEPAGVAVLAAADSVRSMASNRYVGSEVLRQLDGADMIVVTKSDLCDRRDLSGLDEWLDELNPRAPRISVHHGVVPLPVILGTQPTDRASSADIDLDDHSGQYATWEWAPPGAVRRDDLDRFLDAVPVGVLRLKGFVELADGGRVVVQRVGARTTVEPATATFGPPGALIAILARGPDSDASSVLTSLARTHLR